MKKLFTFGLLALLCSFALPSGNAKDWRLQRDDKVAFALAAKVLQNRMPISSIAAGTANQVASNDGTKGTWANIVSLLTAGTNVSITGTTNATISVASAAPSGSASGDLSGSYPGPTVAKILGAAVPSLSNGYLNSAAGVLSWAAGTLPAGVTSTGTGQLTLVPGASTGLSINPSANSLTWLGGTAHSSSDFPTWINFMDSSSNPNFQVLQSSTGATSALLFSQTGATGAGTSPTILFGTNTYQVAASGLGDIAFGDYVSPTFHKGAQIAGVTVNAHSGADLSTLLGFYTTPRGTTNLTQRMQISSEGSIVGNASGVAVPSSATDGFVYIGSGAGQPTGTPTSYNGATPLYYDTTNLIMWIYNGSQWEPVGSSAVTTQGPGVTLTLTVPEDVFVSITSARTLTLPPAVKFPGARIFVKWVAKAGAVVLTIAATAGNVEGSSTATLVESTSAYTTATYESDGSNWWRVAQ